MPNDDPNRSGDCTAAGEPCGKIADLEKLESTEKLMDPADQSTLTILVSDGDIAYPLGMTPEPVPDFPNTLHSNSDKWPPNVFNSKKDYLSRTESSHEQCRVCQQEKEENLVEIGCQCRGGLAKAHQSCIDTWFRIRGSNKCEICQQIAASVPPPESHPSMNYWAWRVDPNIAQEPERVGGLL